MFENLDEICGICLKQIDQMTKTLLKNDILSLINLNEQNIKMPINDLLSKTIAEFLIEFTSIKIDFENFPKSLCLVCTNEIRNIYLFKLKIQQNYLTLVNLIDSQNVKLNKSQYANNSIFDDCVDDNIKEEEIDSSDSRDDKKVRSDHQIKNNRNKINGEKVEKNGRGKRRKKNRKVEVEKGVKQCEICLKKICARLLKSHFVQHIVYIRELNQLNKQSLQFIYKSIDADANNYLCLLCMNKYKTLDEFKEHEQKHEEEVGPFECCCATTNTLQQYKQHLFNEHQFKHLMFCLKCLKTIKHNVKHSHAAFTTPTSNSSYSCYLCDDQSTVFNSKQDFFDHLCTHCDLITNCDECGLALKTQSELYKHKFRKHRHALLPQQHDDPEIIQCCYICGKNDFKSDRQRYDHIRNHTPSGPVQCPICNKVLGSKGSLRHHRRVHSDLMKFVCSECGKSFRFSSNYLEHQRIQHATEYAYECAYKDCQKKFKVEKYLKFHELTHAGEKTHECKHCGKRFVHYPSWWRHNRIHLGIHNKIKCPACDKTYSTNSKRKQHFAKKHPQLDQNAYFFNSSSAATRTE